MKSCTLALALLLICSCTSAPKAAEPLFPSEAGAWKLKQSGDLPPDQVPEGIRRLGFRRAGSATYEGAGNLAVEVYELTSSAAALEAEQTWKPVANTVGVHHENYFSVIHWENADKAAVSGFVREMVKPKER